jgi:copper chaperone NosL
MILKRFNIVVVFGLLLIASCSVEPQDINYGHENCEHCSMTIMDAEFGAEFMTQKGKASKFCSIECMVMKSGSDGTDKKDIHSFYVKDVLAPSEFLNVINVTFLISDQMPSPMGKYLNAFSDKKQAEEYQMAKGGKIFLWDELAGVIN